jgi:hypothetical protein
MGFISIVTHLHTASGFYIRDGSDDSLSQLSVAASATYWY